MPHKIPIPQSINYFWNFRSLIRTVFRVQIVSGILLSLRYYARTRTIPFYSVEVIIREVEAGYIVRGLHLVRSQAILFFIYLHIMRSILYRRRTNIIITLQRTLILVATIGAAFLRYVLPWGQISFWRATVITRFLRVLPYGPDILEWVWRRFTVGHPTLTRFFSLHYILRVAVAPLSLIHIILLHNSRSRRPLRDRNDYYVPFWPYFRVKDLWPIRLTLMFIVYLCLFLIPETENLKNASSITTPTHIKPEWYFLIYYAILRAVPSKSIGLLLIILSILVLVVILLARINFSTSKRGYIIFSIFISICFLLRLLRGKPVEEPFLTGSRLLSLIYFGLAFIIVVVM